MATLTWLGHAGFLIESEGSQIVIDAWLNGPTYPGADLSGVDAVIVSHGHYDHCESVPDIMAGAPQARLACIHEITFWAGERGVHRDRVIGMNKGGTVEVAGWWLTMVDAVHSGGCPGPDEHGHSIVSGGSAAGWIIEAPDGTRIYHAGDTAVFLDMQLIGEMYRPDVALLPIGGHFTMDPAGAAKAVELLGVERVVPMHYGTYPILAGTPDQLRDLTDKHVRIHAMEPGGTLDLSR